MAGFLIGASALGGSSLASEKTWYQCVLEVLQRPLWGEGKGDASARFEQLAHYLGLDPARYQADGFFPVHVGKPGRISNYPGVEGRATLLGEGGTGMVFLTHRLEGGEPIVLKRYRFREGSGGDPAQLPLVQKNDFALMKWIKLKTDVFKVAEYKLGARPLTTEIEYVAGRSLQDVLADPKVPEAVRALLRQQYTQQAEKFVAQMQAAFPDFHAMSKPSSREDPILNPVYYFFRDPATGTGYRGCLKPNQLIVDPWTLEMTLIDPL
ncbi:MAG: hypothetical protein AB7P04_07370 [Bacteriovoracia bacterium]